MKKTAYCYNRCWSAAETVRKYWHDIEIKYKQLFNGVPSGKNRLAVRDVVMKLANVM